MGAAASAMGELGLLLFGPAEVEDPSLGNHNRPIYEYLGLNKFDVAALNAIFQRIRCDKQGRAPVARILSHLGIGRNIFIHKVFTMLCLPKVRGKPRLSIKDFVFSYWNFCSIGMHMGKSLCFFSNRTDQRCKARLSYSLFDIDRKNRLSKVEVLEILRAIHGRKLPNNIEQKGMVSEIGDTTSSDEFVAFTVKHKLSLAPILDIHEKLSMKVLGKARWAQLANKRALKQGGKFKDIYGVLADMKEKTKCDDDIITLDIFRRQILHVEQRKTEIASKKRSRKLFISADSSDTENETVTTNGHHLSSN